MSTIQLADVLKLNKDQCMPLLTSFGMCSVTPHQPVTNEQALRYVRVSTHPFDTLLTKSWNTNFQYVEYVYVRFPLYCENILLSAARLGLSVHEQLPTYAHAIAEAFGKSGLEVNSIFWCGDITIEAY